jgi:sortase A
MGLTPGETRHKSPFYSINLVKVGDYVYVDFNGRRYQYEVVRHYEVKPTQISIEAPSSEPKMILYTCTLGGETDGRDVLEAKLVQKDVAPTADLKVSIHP